MSASSVDKLYISRRYWRSQILYLLKCVTNRITSAIIWNLGCTNVDFQNKPIRSIKTFTRVSVAMWPSLGILLSFLRKGLLHEWEGDINSVYCVWISIFVSNYFIKNSNNSGPILRIRLNTIFNIFIYSKQATKNKMSVRFNI